MNKRGKRLLFEQEQLHAIFNASLYRGCVDGERGYYKVGKQRPRNARFWVPLIAPFTGTRLGAICQVATTDVCTIMALSASVPSRRSLDNNAAPCQIKQTVVWIAELLLNRASDMIPIHVGIIGYAPPRSWAAVAHAPAIASLDGQFVLTGIANSTAASAQAAAATLPGVRAFASAAALIESPDVDLIAIVVKVPHHAELVRLALAAGKHVLCEWPLARTLDEATELAALADVAGVVAAVGMQAGHVAAVRRVRAICEDGKLGPLLSATVVGNGMTWGESIERHNAYLLDPANGATMLTIAVGHALTAIEAVLGPVAEVAATVATRRTVVTVQETDERIAQATADQVLLACTTTTGLPVSLHYRGGLPRGLGLTWEIDGVKGSVRVTSPSGLVEMTPLTVEVRRRGDKTWTVDMPPSDRPAIEGVASIYKSLAEAIAGRASDVPRFADAARLHALIATIERSAATGRRLRVEG